MPKSKTRYLCQSCGSTSPKWLGKCPQCDAWNSLVEEKVIETSRPTVSAITADKESSVLLSEISSVDRDRWASGIVELDRVLGGGLVPGSLVLLGGDPGIGKSTLVLSLLDRLAQSNTSALYVTGEESKEQIKGRAERLGVGGDPWVLAENCLDRALEQAKKLKPQVIVFDSIQTLYCSALESAPGTVSQVREATSEILAYAKSTGTACLIIGHVTKEGNLAGPRLLEHMVDTVLYFEGERTGQFRILRTIKNRFGSTNEIGVFEMTATGLKDVLNPSATFLSSRSQSQQGSCVTATLEGTRPILTEVQSLVSSSHLAQPRRTCVGLEPNRLALIVAVLEKHAGLTLYNQDIYLNVAGGLKLVDPASDAAVLVSLLSSFQNREIRGDLMVVGEVGLNGQIRAVTNLDLRLAEAEKLGYRQVIVPKQNKIKGLKTGLELWPVETAQDLLEIW